MVTLAPGLHRFRLELWDHAGPARQAIVSQSLSLERTSVLSGEGTFRGELGLEDPALAFLTRGTILRLYDQIEDEATLWRYTGQTKIRTQTNALRMELRGDALWMDFRHGLVRSVQADGRTLTTFGLFGLTPTEWLSEFILPGYDGDAVSFALGTVDPVDPVNLEFDDDSPLSALRKLEQETESEAEFVPNAAGDTYTINLRTRIGKMAELVELRYTKNLQGVKRNEEEVDPASRLYAHGAHGLTLGDATWEVGGIVGNDISFAGEHPVFEDDAFVGDGVGIPFIYFYAGGTAYQITASDATAGTLTLDSVAGLNVGDVGWLASAADGTRLMYLESPSSRADIGVKVGTFTREDIPNVSNLLANGDLTAWTAGVPDAWSLLGAPVVAEETSPVYGQHGSRSAHVTAAAADEGLITDAIDITADDREPYHSILAGLTLVSGRVRMELRHSNGQIYPLEERAQVAALDVYTMLKSYPVATEPLPVGTAQLAIVAHEGAAEWYLDTAMVTHTVGEIEPEFLVGSGAHALWQATAAELAELAIPRVEYEVQIADLGLADPDRWPWERLNLGDDVKLRDPDIGNVTLRVVELSQDVLNVRATRVVVAPGPWSRPNDPFRPARRTQVSRATQPEALATRRSSGPSSSSRGVDLRTAAGFSLDGSNESANLTAAVAQAKRWGVKRVTVEGGTLGLPAAYATDPEVEIRVENGGLIRPLGAGVTIRGSFDAGLYQVFDLSAGGTVTPGTDSTDGILPEWWGGKGDGATGSPTDNTAALQAAIDAAIASGTPLELATDYAITSTLVAGASGPVGNLRIVGRAWQQTRIRQLTAGQAVLDISRIGGGHTDRFWLENVSLWGGTYGLYGPDNAYVSLKSVRVVNTTIAAIYLNHCWGSSLVDVHTRDNTGDGIQLVADANAITLRGVHSYRNGGVGLSITNFNGVGILGGTLEANGAGGATFGDGKGLSIRGIYTEGNSDASGNGFDFEFGTAGLVSGLDFRGNYLFGEPVPGGSMYALIFDRVNGADVGANHIESFDEAFRFVTSCADIEIAASNKLVDVTREVGGPLVSGLGSLRIFTPSFVSSFSAPAHMGNLIERHILGWSTKIVGTGGSITMEDNPTVKITRGTGGNVYQEEIDVSGRLSGVRGKYVTFFVIVRTTASVSITISLDDDVGSVVSQNFTVNGVTRVLSVTRKIDPAATYVRAAISTNTNSSDVWVEGTYVVVGTEQPPSEYSLPIYLNGTPTTGTWKVGDRVIDPSPSVGSPPARVCTAAGTPGTWAAEANLV